MSLWQELESLQKKQAELNDRLVSFVEKEQDSLERMALMIEGMIVLAENMHELDVQLNHKYEGVSKLISMIAELEKTLRKPVKEPTMEEPEEQPMEMIVQTAASS